MEHAAENIGHDRVVNDIVFCVAAKRKNTAFGDSLSSDVILYNRA